MSLAIIYPVILQNLQKSVFHLHRYIPPAVNEINMGKKYKKLISAWI